MQEVWPLRWSWECGRRPGLALPLGNSFCETRASGITSLSLAFCYLWFLFYLFLERGEGRENERERNISVWLPLAHPYLGTWTTTQAWALTGK